MTDPEILDSSCSSMRQRPLLSRVQNGTPTAELDGMDSAAEYEHRLHGKFKSDRSTHGDDDRSEVPWYEKLRIKATTSLTETSREDWLLTAIPCLSWLKTYNWKLTFPADLMAGLTVGLMVIPQSISYAKLAGLPVEFGLYSALMPVYAYAVFGSSNQLQVGPVALVSLLVSTGLTHALESSTLDPDSDEYQTVYNTLAIQCSLLIGLVYLTAGLLRAGFITIFLSHTVVSGFTSGAAVIIGCSQLKYLFGYDIGRPDTVQEVIVRLIEGIDKFNYKTFLMGLSSIFFLLAVKHVGGTYKKFKWLRAAGPLLLTVVAIVLTVAFGLNGKGIPVVGHIPQGFPDVTISQWTPMTYGHKLISPVISIALIGFMESIAIAKQLASIHKYEVDASKELIGLGMANLLGSAFNAYPSAGSFSRSAVNNDSGAKSPLAGMVTATLVLFALFLLTPIFQELPLNTLAAIVISGVIGLFDYAEAIHLWKVDKLDFGVWLAACAGSMFAGSEIGLAIAVSSSVLVVIYQSAFPQIAVSGRLPGTNTYRNIKVYPEAETYNGIVIVRIEGPLYFANSQHAQDIIRRFRVQAELEMAKRDGQVKFVIVDMSPVSHIDPTALHQLETMVGTYRSRGQELVFADTSSRVVDSMIAAGLVDKIGESFFFASVHEAVTSCLQELDEAAEGLMKSNGDDLDEESGSQNNSEAGC